MKRVFLCDRTLCRQTGAYSFKEKIEKLDKFQVVTPIVGKFSTGKSSLVNALLGKDYLGVKLTPETSSSLYMDWTILNSFIDLIYLHCQILTHFYP